MTSSPSSTGQQPGGSLDDVLSFIRTLLPAAAASPAPSLSSSESESEGHQLLAQSEQLLRILDAAVSTEQHQPSSYDSLTANAANAVVAPLREGGARLSATSWSTEILVAAGGRSLAAPPIDRESGEANGARTKHAAVKHNKYREKMKREVEYLRSRASELEQELEALRAGSSTRPTAQSKKNAIMSAAWQRIAKSQQGLRLASEAENHNLKRELRMYLEMTRTMAQTLGKRPNASSSLVGVAGYNRKRGRGAKDRDAAFFKDLVDDLDVAFEQLDSVFKSNGLDKVTTEMKRTIQTKTTLGDRGNRGAGATQFMEMCDVEVTPFAMWVAANASWQSTVKNFSAPKHGRLERRWESDDILACVSCAQGKREPLRCRVVVKRYTGDANRVVLVWRSQTECIGGGFSGYVADETGWGTLEPIESKTPGRASSSGSISRTCVQFVQWRKSLSPAAAAVDVRASEFEKFTELVLGMHEEDMADLSKTMENLLLDEATGAAGGDGARSLERIR